MDTREIEMRHYFRCPRCGGMWRYGCEDTQQPVCGYCCAGCTPTVVTNIVRIWLKGLYD